VKSEIGNSIKFRAVGFFATLYFGEPITLISSLSLRMTSSGLALGEKAGPVSLRSNGFRS
jgi:hypothetical protein